MFRHLLAILLVLVVHGPATAQSPLPLDAWTGAESWPELPPGKLGSNLTRLQNMRLTLDAVFGAPGGKPTTIYLDVTRVGFQATPAIWVQFLSMGAEDSPTNGTAALDAIVIDEASARALFRLQSAPPLSGAKQAWAGAYSVTHYGPGDLARVVTNEDGTTTTKRLAVPPVAEFATLGFVLPGLSLRTGLQMRIPGFTPGLDQMVTMPLRVEGRVPFTNAAGTTREVWAVDLLSANRQVIIRLFVTEEAPFFHGWIYRRVSDGQPLTSFTLRRWQPID
jgi:hypothetical protein